MGAIDRARRWVDQLTAGVSLSEIATQEGKTPRHIRQVTSHPFLPPRLVNEIINVDRRCSATDLAGHIPLVW